MARVTVALVDDHPVVHEGMRAWLERDPERRIELVAAGDSVDGVLAGPGRDADVVLLDLNLHGHMAVGDVTRLAEAGRRVVVYSEHTDDATVLAVLERGAFAFLAKREAREHCVATILAAAEDRPYVPPLAAGTMAADERPERPALSEQERTALLLWFQSMSKAGWPRGWASPSRRSGSTSSGPGSSTPTPAGRRRPAPSCSPRRSRTG